MERALWNESCCFDVTQYGYVAERSETHTASIQAAIDSAAAAKGGTVLLPAGEYLLDASLRLDAPGIAVAGVPRATKITITDVNLIPFYISGSANVIRDLEITHDQPAPGSVEPWAPKQYQPTVYIDGASGTLIKDVVFVNPTAAISAKKPRGLTIEGIRGQPLQSGIQIDSADTNVRVQIRDIIFEPFWFSADRRVLAYQHRSAIAFSSFSNNFVNVSFEDVTANHYSVGFFFSGNNPAAPFTRQSITKAKNLDCRLGILMVGAEERLAVIDYSFRGLGGNASLNCIYIYGSNMTFYCQGLRCDGTGSSAIQVDGSESSRQMALFNNVFVKDWNQQASGLAETSDEVAAVSLPPPFDQIESTLSAAAASDVYPAIYAGAGAYVEVSGEKSFFQTPPANWPIEGGPGNINIV